MQSNFRLVMRSGPTVGKIFPLDKAELFVGRDLSNDVVINDPEISRRHARLFQQGNSFVLEDLGSTNGTFVNGQRLIGPNILHPGDSITFGERMGLIFEAETRAPYGAQSAPQGYQQQPAYSPGYQQPSSNLPPIPQSQPVDNYAGQIPSDYAPEEPPAKKKLPVIWIVLIAVLLLTCLCIMIAAWFAPREFWCLFPVWPEGYCP